MTKNKKLLIGLICLAFCLCCAVFGLGFAGKGNIVAKADTISTTTIKSASATTAKSISLTADVSAEPQAVAEDIVEDELEENQDITNEEYIEMEEPEDDGSETAEYGIVVPPPPYPSLFKTVTIRGCVTWIDDDGNAHPLRQVKIQITDYDVSDYIIYTDDEGKFELRRSFMVTNKIDIIAYAIDENENIKVTNQDGEVYSYLLESEISIPRGTSVSPSIPITILENLPIYMNTQSGQAFQILQAVITARDFAKEMMGNMPSAVTVIYPFNSFLSFYDENEIVYSWYHVEPFTPSYACWDVIMHEYGHHIAAQLGISDLSFKGYTHDSSESLAESHGKYSGINISWIEAWPTVFGMIAQRYYVGKGLLSDIKTVGDSYYTDYFGYEYDIDAEAERKGEACEQSIMGILWDLFDNDIEENDTIALGYQKFWNVTTRNRVKTFSDFIQVFYNTYPSLIDAIGANLSYYNIAPTRLEIHNNSLDNVPTFTWDAGGGVQKYLNNEFVLKFYDTDRNLLLSILQPYDNSYILYGEMWAKILDAKGDYFYWSVEAKNDYELTVTGPYIATMQKVMKPNVGIITLELNRNYIVYEVENEYAWYEFVAPCDGTYIFYTEGESDTQCTLYARFALYDIDDNSGTNMNFKVSVDLYANSVVYLKVKVKTFFQYYTIHVDMESP